MSIDDAKRRMEGSLTMLDCILALSKTAVEEGKRSNLLEAALLAIVRGDPAGGSYSGSQCVEIAEEALTAAGLSTRGATGEL